MNNYKRLIAYSLLLTISAFTIKEYASSFPTSVVGTVPVENPFTAFADLDVLFWKPELPLKEREDIFHRMAEISSRIEGRGLRKREAMEELSFAGVVLSLLKLPQEERSLTAAGFIKEMEDKGGEREWLAQRLGAMLASAEKRGE